jgi:hypothetical protein
MLPTRPFAGVVYRALSHSQVSLHLSVSLCLLIFHRLFGAMRLLHPLLLLLDKKEATYARAHPRMVRVTYL